LAPRKIPYARFGAGPVAFICVGFLFALFVLPVVAIVL
jgi:hypothetical protein